MAALSVSARARISSRNSACNLKAAVQRADWYDPDIHKTGQS